MEHHAPLTVFQAPDRATPALGRRPVWINAADTIGHQRYIVGNGGDAEVTDLSRRAANLRRLSQQAGDDGLAVEALAGAADLDEITAE